jgi:hypothetical protein
MAIPVEKRATLAASSGTGTIDSPASNSTWSDGSNKWQAYGSEDPAASGRSASVTDTSNNALASGTAVTPIQHNPQYQWGFQFSNLTVGQQVFINVTLSFPDGSMKQLSIPCTVGN